MNLSPHFSLAELTLSQDATRHGIYNEPGPEETAQLQRLCRQVLEPLRMALERPVVVSSGYRSPELNLIAGGSKTSHHMQGRAADIIVPGLSPLVVCKAIMDLGLPVSQVIHEFGRWCHVSVALDVGNPELQTLTARKVKGRTVYEAGLNPVE